MSDEIKDQKQPSEDKPVVGSPQPSIDIDSLRSEWRKEIQASMQQQQQADDQPDEQHRDDNPLERVIDPILQPRLNKLQLQSMAAQDAAIFYASTPDAIHMRDEIEQHFNNMLKQGTPLARTAIYDYLWGKNREKHIQDAIKKHDEEIAKAKEAAEANTGLVPGSRATPKDPYAMTEEELGTALKDLPF